MPKRFFSIALPVVLLVALLVAYFAWRHFSTPSTVSTTGMASGSVISSSTSGADLELNVGYVARGQRLQTTGTVSAAEFDQQGKVVWVCFNPSAPADTVLRLPMDPLCADGG